MNAVAHLNFVHIPFIPPTEAAAEKSAKIDKSDTIL